MALMKCAKCGKYVSNKNATCSRCNTPITNNISSADKEQAAKWESAGLFMAATGGLTFLIFDFPNITGVIMTVSGLMVYAAGKFLLGKYI